MKNRVRGIPRLINASRYSWQGLRAAWAKEEAFRLEIGVVSLGVPLAIWLARGAVEFLLLVLPLLLLVLTELLNSAIEAVVDRHGSERHELSGRAKDMGSAAVLIAIVIAVTSWTVIVGTRVWESQGSIAG